MYTFSPIPKTSKKTIRIIGIVIIVTTLFGIGVLVGATVGASSYAFDGKVESKLLSQVKKTLDEKFVFWKASSTLPTDKELEYGMVKGFVDSYKDPYTVFFPPSEAKSFAENVVASVIARITFIAKSYANFF